MTQTISTDTIKRFRKAFPEIQKEYSEMEIIAHCRAIKRNKKMLDRSIEKRIKRYER